MWRDRASRFRTEEKKVNAQTHRDGYSYRYRYCHGDAGSVVGLAMVMVILVCGGVVMWFVWRY